MSNLDDFDQPPENFEPEDRASERKAGFGKNIASAWQASPVFKIFLLLVGGGAIASAALGVFNSDNGAKPAKSVVQQGAQISATPGGEAPPAFQEAVNEASAQRAQNAARQGGSALPTPMGNTTQMTNMDPSAQASDDPLAEFRAQQAAAQEPAAPAVQQRQNNNQQQQRVGGNQQPMVNGEPPLDQNLAQAMQQQMQSIMGSWAPTNSKIIKVTANEPTGGQNGTGGTGQQQQQQQFDFGKTLIQAGTINYGQMIMEANSDVPGPIMVQILSGPFSGARAIGRFSVQNDYLVMQFNLVNFKGKDYPVDILALDPDTTLGGMATETDQRYWSRVFLPAAAEFVSGFAQGFTQADQNVYIQDGVVVSQRAGGSLRKGLGQGAQEAGDRVSTIINDQASKVKPLVKVAAGTPIGLFFTRTVTENTPPNPQQQVSTYPQNGIMGQTGGINPYQQQGQNGYGMTGYGTNGYGTGYGTTGYGTGYDAYGTQNTYNQQGYAYPTTQQTTTSPYAPLNNRSSSTNYGGGVTVVPANGTGTTVINSR